MKKLGKVLIALFIVSLIMLTGCQRDLDKETLIGRYQCETINGKSLAENLESYLEIIDEKTYTLVYNGYGFNFDFPGNYRVEGNKLFLDGFYDDEGNEEEQECEVDGDTIRYTIRYTEIQTEFEYLFKKIVA